MYLKQHSLEGHLVNVKLVVFTKARISIIIAHSGLAITIGTVRTINTVKLKKGTEPYIKKRIS